MSWKNPPRRETERDPTGTWTMVVHLYVTENDQVAFRWHATADTVDVHELARILEAEIPPLVDEVRPGWGREILRAAIQRCSWVLLADSLRREPTKNDYLKEITR